MSLILIAVVLALIGIGSAFSSDNFGPQWWKTLMHRYERWAFGDAAPIMPIDPYKPISQALNESSDHFPPAKKRLENAFLQRGLFYLIGIVIGIILISLLRR
jgi:hypothetical protein